MPNGNFENLTVTQKTELFGETNTLAGSTIKDLKLGYYRWQVAASHKDMSSVIQATQEIGSEIVGPPPGGGIRPPGGGLVIPPQQPKILWTAPKPASLTLQPDGGNVGIGVLNPNAKLEVAGDVCATQFQWGNHSSIDGDQGGSIDLGGDPVTPGTGTPYIDFHYRGKIEDYNTRIINDGDGQLSLVANTVYVHGRKSVSPHDASAKLEVNGDVKVSGSIFLTGDIVLTNADCAEDFDIVNSEQVVPGTVLIINEGGALRPSHQAYDKCVAGVVSGAGDFRPGITLDKQAETNNRLPVALVGKVYCNVDSQYGRIEVGDLLTTSPTPGYAMKVSDPLKAFGAVIGKALRGWTEGQGLIPILVALQ